MYGDRPYNFEIQPSENLFVSLITFGEGWHNFHHTYPKDYRASEKYKNKRLIDFNYKIFDIVFKKTEKVKGMDKFDKNNYCKLD